MSKETGFIVKRWGIFYFLEERNIDLCVPRFFFSKEEALQYMRVNGKNTHHRECYIGMFALHFAPYIGTDPCLCLVKNRIRFPYWAMVNAQAETLSVGPRTIHFSPGSKFHITLQSEVAAVLNEKGTEEQSDEQV